MEDQSFGDRLKHAWNVFRSGETSQEKYVPAQTVQMIGSTGNRSFVRSDRKRLKPSSQRPFVGSMYNKIAVDVAAVPIKHVRTDDDDRYIETINSGLNECLSVEANLDQTGRDLVMDIVLSMFDEGVVAVVPVDCDVDIENHNTFQIHSMRTGKIVEWFPENVKVELYDERTGNFQQLLLPKKRIAIIENPFYAIMNQPNSTVTRLLEKINLLDKKDKENHSSKFNMILQLPYTIKSAARKQQAKDRLTDLENQLSNSQYGIAYVDGTEKIHQLNGSIDNALVSEIQRLTDDLRSELGITKEIFDGTADERTTLNYQNRTIEPILAAITGEFNRKFLTKTARTQGQEIKAINDPFRFVTIDKIIEVADTLTRNEIAVGNEIRTIIGWRPLDDPRAEELRNKNLNKSEYDMEDEMLEDEQYLEEEEQDLPPGQTPISALLNR